jgi:hypothetical protein
MDLLGVLLLAVIIAFMGLRLIHDWALKGMMKEIQRTAVECLNAVSADDLDSEAKLSKALKALQRIEYLAWKTAVDHEDQSSQNR